MIQKQSKRVVGYQAGIFYLAYLLCATVGNWLSFHPHDFVVFWLPSGLYVATLLLNPIRLWPVYVLAAFAANLSFDVFHGRMPLMSLGFCLGNSLEALAGAWLMRRFICHKPTLESTKEVVGLAGFAALFSTTLSATVGTFIVTRFAGSSSFLSTWLLWWSGDLMGVLLVAPVILIWAKEVRVFLSGTHRFMQFLLLLAGVNVLAWLIYAQSLTEDINAKFILLPVLSFVAIRFGLCGASLAGLSVAVVTTWTVTNWNPSVPDRFAVYRQVAILDLFLASVSLTGLLLAATTRERDRREQELDRYFNSALDLLCIADTKGFFRRLNREWEKTLGYALSDLQNIRFLDLVHPDDREATLQAVTELVEQKVIPSFTNRYRHKDGSYRWIEWRAFPDGELIYAVARDITQRKLVEEELRQSQKLESIGQLAGGVAHDFNNILSSMIMQLGFLRQNPRLEAEIHTALNELREDAQRAANLTRQLLMFSRRSILEMRVLDLNEVVANLLKMLGRLIGEPISIRFDRGVGVTLVEADPGMLEQVLMNLSVNARDAMPKGGRLTVGIERIEADEARVRPYAGVRPGPFICLSVSDTGCGMDESTLKRIFEPFFTTKDVGKGTGLGLATVYGIVAQHKGWVEVESKPGLGSTFRVLLPAMPKNAQDAATSEQQVVIRGQETILLVEDEASLRKATAQCLRHLGYRVFEAHDGLEALQVWKQHQPQIELLFSDMVMPEGMTGLDLAEKLRQSKPGLKVIIASGYSEEITGQGVPASKGIVRVQKPYEIEAFSKIIRDCLDGRQGRPDAG